MHKDFDWPIASHTDAAIVDIPSISFPMPAAFDRILDMDEYFSLKQGDFDT
ncbi:hypothetical protein PO185_07320 [Limosilactobacillus mucosae]|uniref:hypothetical protein n=1 Tax=Limosilactobacillus mucosae TaxID=97478 RepID=UPI00233E8069|nr:hypothetical protein [Limosilactobacillus mucosae]MDC2839038.1 hypothetical protein [Limosilactobacillus mucosae]MDC2841469.1 hypothetical protein [Limosilactobacillus mucosae]MDC2845451.1 hypothetical protein [Limosilactobacillus mucosae]